MNTPPMLRVQGLTVRLDGKTILDDVSFEAGDGQFLAVIGPNGAGKSTLLRHLNRLLPVRQGRVELRGRPVEAYSHRDLARLMSYVPQTKGFIAPYRVREFLLMNRYPHLAPLSPPGRRDGEIVGEILHSMDLARFQDRFLDTLSGGERQKVFIAGALVQESPLILMDEPTTFLDPLHGREIHELLRALNRDHGKTILMVTHDVNAALTLAGRLLCLKAGRVHFWGAPARPMDLRVLDTLFDVPFLEYCCPAEPAAPPAYLGRWTAP